MRIRKLWLSAASAAVGLAAIGTVVAQQPASREAGPATVSPTPAPVLPATTVRTYSEWSQGTPSSPAPGKPSTGAAPAAGPLHSTPVVPAGGARQRLTSPVMAGPDGVRPAGGFELPPPTMDLPSNGAAPATLPPETALPAGPGTAEPPRAPAKETESKFPPPVALPDPGVTPPETSAPAPLPLPSAPAVPVPPSIGTPALPAPGSTPAVSPAVSVPPSPSRTPTADLPAKAPASEPAPVSTGSTIRPGTEATTAVGMLPGRSSPNVMVETVCPETVVFGQEFQYKLIVRNMGTTPVSSVRVESDLPAGSRYVGSDPTGELLGTRLVWTVVSLEAGAEKQITVRVKPGAEGEARSRATVTFSTAVDARTRVTRPRIAAAITSVESARAGEETIFQIKVTNSGSGPASKMVLHARLSDGLVHPQGVELECPLESLPPGETRMVPLKVSAAKAGLQWCQILVAAEGSADSTAKASVNVVEPMLVVKQTGPAKCLVRTEPTYTIELSNPGTAATDPVQLHTVLPEGFECVQASDGGAAIGKTVTWRLPSLAAGGTRSLTLKLRATADTGGQVPLLTIAQAGAGAVTPVGGAPASPARSAGRGIEAKAETMIAAEGIAAVRFEIVGLDNPVLVGKECTYEIRVMNQGTGPCSNVQIAAALPEGTEFVSATSGTSQEAKVKSQGLQLVFEPIASLAVKGEMVYRVRVRGAVAGDLRFRVQLTCDQLKTPLLKEESTRFYKQQ